MTNPPVTVNNLNKEFKSPIKAEGFIGTIKTLVKPNYKTISAVNNVSFQINAGEFVGFLGPNGAGKTTTIKMLAGILKPTSGELAVLDQEPFKRTPEMLSQIALVMGNRQQLWWDLPAWDSFIVLREIYNISHSDFKERSEYLIEELNLTDKINTQVRKLSLGERMKCELVAALLHNPKLVFLDEPTIGLDLTSQRNLRTFLKSYNQRTKSTILLTSHYMQDVEELCQRIIIINKGTKVYDGDLTSLKSKYANVRRLNLTFTEPVPEQALSQLGIIISHSPTEAVLEIPATETAKTTSLALNTLPISDIKLAETEVEEVIERAFES